MKVIYENALSRFKLSRDAEELMLTILPTASKGLKYHTDKNNYVDDELSILVTRLNSEVSSELFTYLGPIRDGLRGISSSLREIKEDSDMTISTTVTATSLAGGQSTLFSPAIFAYDNTCSLMELIPTLREQTAAENVLRYFRFF